MNLIKNPGAEDGKGDQPSIWFAAQVPAEGLRMWRDTEHSMNETASLAISNDHDYAETVSNNWAQSLIAVPRGRVLQVTAWIRTEDADAVNVCLQCWDLTSEKMVAFAGTPIIRGDQQWARFDSDPLLVPPETAKILVRAALTGKGKAWFDNISVKEIKIPSPASSGRPQEIRPNATPTAAPTAEEDLDDMFSGPIVTSLPIIKDCMVLSYIPQWAHGNVDNVGVANNGGGVRALFKWETIHPEHIARDDVSFVLAVYSRKTTSRELPGRIGAYEILEDWPENTSWTTQPETAKDPCASAEFLPGEGWRLLDITSMVRAQAKENRAGHGIQLRFDDESKTAEDWSGYSFVTRHAEAGGGFPRLVVVKGHVKKTSMEAADVQK
jgi:hypothetical protein